MGELAGASPDRPYKDRLRLLKENGMALWDVCAAGQRSGSGDSAIRMSTVETNDFSRFLRAHAGVCLIYFNGKEAKEIYDRKVRQEPFTLFERIRYETLPSTSPANAAMRYEQKLSRWRTVLGEVSASRSPRSSTGPRPPAEVEIYSCHQGSPS
jgi:hypoxanthine-DNA glycosylase